MSARSRQKRPRSRPPGRPPAGAPDLRQKLLDAARALFIAKGFGNVGTRELARAAGVSPAMIPYYFGDKQGLYDALIDDAIGRVLGRLQRLAAAPKSAPTEDPIDAFLSVYLATLIAEPWIPQLLVREVLAHDSPFRRRFREHFATPARAALGALLRGEQERGTLRPDLDLELTTLSLVGMTAFPFLVHPVLGEVPSSATASTSTRGASSSTAPARGARHEPSRCSRCFASHAVDRRSRRPPRAVDRRSRRRRRDARRSPPRCSPPRRRLSP
jgi:AcrR family transcriptional regulator